MAKKDTPEEAGTDLAEINPAAQALGLTNEEYTDLIEGQEEEFSDDSLQIPILKIGQPLTREVQAEQAEPGEFINTLTGDGLGNELTFIVAYYQQGRFAADRETNKAYVAFGDVIPDAWEPLLGAQFVGTRFDEHPDAEEVYKERVNNKEIEWGKGPLVSTTYNFTGFVVLPDEVVGEDAEITDRLMPVRLSLQRTGKKAADKIKTLKRAVLRNRPYWEQVISLRSDEREFGRNSAYIVDPNAVRFTRQTTAEEKALASQLALAVIHGRTNQAGDVEGDEEKAKSAAPEAAEGALDIG